MTDFPASGDAVAPDWLAAQLGQPTHALRQATAGPVGSGQVCDSFRLTLDWDEAAVTAPVPRTLIAKGPSHDPASRAAAAMFDLYAAEVGWYRDHAAAAGVRCPRAYGAFISDDATACLLLLEDCAPAEQGDQVAGATAAMVDAALAETARLHAYRQGDAAWSSIYAERGANRGALVAQMLPMLWGRFVERFAPLVRADTMALGAEVVARYAASIEADAARDPATLSLTHGDLRIDNILFHPDPAARAILLDWQTVSPGYGASDVAYLIGTSFADDDTRRAAEPALVDAYVSRCAGHGARVDEAAFRHAYRRAAVSGLMMAINASAVVEQTPRGDAMFAAMADRSASLAIDHDTLSVM